MPDRRFRDMRLTEEEVEARLKAYCERTHELMWKYPDGIRYAFTQTGHARAKRLLPRWRAEAIRRNRLWFALVGLGFDIEGDSLSDMTSREMLERIEQSMVPRHQLDFILSELDR